MIYPADFASSMIYPAHPASSMVHPAHPASSMVNLAHLLSSTLNPPLGIPAMSPLCFHVKTETHPLFHVKNYPSDSHPISLISLQTESHRHARFSPEKEPGKK